MYKFDNVHMILRVLWASVEASRTIYLLLVVMGSIFLPYFCFCEAYHVFRACT